jgi:pimeloyl-ACP methyl ester carboxylesterase
VYEMGHGRPLVFLPSMFLHAASYRACIHELQHHFHTFAVEMPGSANGSKLGSPWSFERYADWLLTAIERIGVDRPLLIGHSNSAAVALIAAARSPQAFAGVVVVDSVGADTTHSLVRVIAGRTIDIPLEVRFSLSSGPHALYNLLFHTRNVFHEIHLSAHWDAEPSARALSIPVLLAWGAVDFTEPRRCLAEFQEWIPHARVHICPDGSHDWLVTHAREFADAMVEFASHINAVVREDHSSALTMAE